jgi:hypothetical protein
MQNARALWDAPLVFVAVLLLAFGLSYWINGLRYQGVVDQKAATIESLKSQIDALQNKIKDLQQRLDNQPVSPTVPPHDPDSLYQLGELVARAPGGNIDRIHGEVSFPRGVRGGSNFNVHSTMEYRQFVLSDCHFDASSEEGSLGTITGVGYWNVKCLISGVHQP